MSALRLPLRLARREVWRRPGRTLLVMFLVALPVAGMASAAVLLRTDTMTAAEEWADNYGEADAVGWSEQRFDAPSPAPDLPPGARAVAVRSSFHRVRTAEGGHRSPLEATDLPLADRITTGIVDLVEGRAPLGAGQVALAREVAERLHVGVGDELVLERPALRLQVVGLVERPGCLDCPIAVFAPGAIPLELSRLGATHHLVDLPELPLDEQRSLAARSGLELRADALALYGQEDEAEGVQWSLVIGAVVLTVTGVVISAAFAVGARRQLVTLGQLSATGASPATVRTALVLQGTVAGAAGALMGLALAALLLGGFQSQLEEVVNRRFAGYRVRAVDLLGAAGFGVAAATIAALIPARTAAQVPTLTALAGRRPLTSVPRRQIVGGGLAVAAGLGFLALAVLGSSGGGESDVWVLVAIVGGISELLGACAIAPAVAAWLEPFGRRVRGPWRLAARGLARNRTRTGAVIAAVAAAGALAVASTSLIRGAELNDGDPLPFPDDAVLLRTMVEPTGDELERGARPQFALPDEQLQAEVTAVLPDAEEVRLRTVELPSAPEAAPGLPVGGWSLQVPGDDEQLLGGLWIERLTVADDAVLDVLELDDAGRERLAEVGVAAVVERAQPDARLEPPAGTPVPVAVVRGEHTVGWGIDVLVTEARAAELGLRVAPTAVLFRNPEPLDAAARGLLEDARFDVGGPQPEVSADGAANALVRFTELRWHEPDDGPSPFQLELLLSGIALVFALLVVGTSLALAAAESKDERDVLTTVGAPPRALARAAGARAWLLAALGAALAVPTGFLPVVVFSRTAEGGFPLVFPGTTVALLLLAVPLVVGVVALASSATAQRLRPVRVSTSTFD